MSHAHTLASQRCGIAAASRGTASRSLDARSRRCPVAGPAAGIGAANGPFMRAIAVI